MLIRLLIIVPAGLIFGIAFALGLVFGPAELGGIQIGSWHTNKHIGSVDASPLTRAIIARRGLLALRQTETVYFSADHDSEGRAFDENCTYRLYVNEAPQARWWSVTLYAEDEFLALNGEIAHSVTADDTDTYPVEAIISQGQTRSPAHRISSRNSGAFNLTLRLYHPDEGVVADAATAMMPVVERIDCGATS
jgi:hypothetical protein